MPAADQVAATDVVLRDGRTMQVRLIRPDDRAAMAALWHRLSPETIHQRFFGPKSMDREQLRHLVEVDNDTRMALVAELEGRIVGVARLERSTEDWPSAEFALTVEDAEQGHGIGTVLFTALVLAAEQVGIPQLHADIMHSNAAMMAIITHAGLDPDLRDYGDRMVARVTVPTKPPDQ